MPLSYTQNLEDYHLALAFAGQERGFYIDIGAGHPVADNVSLWFYDVFDCTQDAINFFEFSIYVIQLLNYTDTILIIL